MLGGATSHYQLWLLEHLLVPTLAVELECFPGFSGKRAGGNFHNG